MSIKAVVSRCIINILQNAAGLQVAQVRLNTGEVVDDLEYFEQYGFTSTAPKGKREGIALFLDGDRGNGLLISVANRQYRIKGLKDGEVALYDDKGQYVKILQDGNIKVKANARVLAETPLFETTGNAKIGGNLEVVGTTKMTGAVTAESTALIKGSITGQSGMAVSGGSGASVSGNMVITGGNVTADGIGLKTHRHTAQGATAPTTSAHT